MTTETRILHLTQQELDAIADRAAKGAVAELAHTLGLGLTCDQLARKLKVTERTVRNRVKRGDLPKPTAGRWPMSVLAS